MFGLRKPGYVQLRESLPESLRGTFDKVFHAIEGYVPCWWRDRTRERTLNLVMAEWLIAVADAKELPVSPKAYRHAAKIAEITRRFNAGDFKDGFSSTSQAMQILAELHASGLLPPQDER